MSILGNLFGGKSKENEQQTTPQASTPVNNGSIEPTTGLLNLKKGDILDLTKYSTSLSKVRAAAGWDVNVGPGHDYDLDLCAYLLRGDRLLRTVYYGNKNYTGIYLDGDNLTGGGDGDDENIFVTLNEIPSDVDRIVFAVVIYSASSRNQSFKNVKNAYMRLVDEGAGGKEICKYILSTDGGNHTAAVMASLNKGQNGWMFEAIGDYSKDTIETLAKKVARM